MSWTRDCRNEEADRDDFDYTGEYEDEDLMVQYESENAQFAIAAMKELVRQGTADFLLLGNDELREWWKDYLHAEKVTAAKVAAREAAVAEAKRLAALRKDLIRKMTPDERKALGF